MKNRCVKMFIPGISLCLLFSFQFPNVATGQLTGKIVVKAGKLIDVKTGRILENQIILIEGDRIKQVGSAADVKIPAGAQVVDLSDKTVLPGLIDCHTHLTFDPDQNGYEALGISVPRQALTGAKNARITLEAGFTTVRNVGAGGYSDIALRDAINAGDVIGPRIDASGPAIGVTGGHCDNSLLAPEFHFRDEGVADGVAAVMSKTREVVKYGADVVKICATGGVLSKGDSPGATQFNDEEIRAIIVEAHRLGRKVAAHAHGSAGIQQAVLAGVDSIEHGSYINDENIRAMKERKVYLVPTLYLGDWFLENYQKICKWMEIDISSVIGMASTKAPAPVAQVHFRKARTISPKTAQALAQMILTAQAMLSEK